MPLMVSTWFEGRTKEEPAGPPKTQRPDGCCSRASCTNVDVIVAVVEGEDDERYAVASADARGHASEDAGTTASEEGSE